MVDEAEDRPQHFCTDCKKEIPQEEVVMLWVPSSREFEYWCANCAELQHPEAS